MPSPSLPGSHAATKASDALICGYPQGSAAKKTATVGTPSACTAATARDRADRSARIRDSPGRLRIQRKAFAEYHDGGSGFSAVRPSC